ncbi:MAG: cytochrome c peroxidase [Bacteroidota bacterium]|nr:c-type cytochrome [Candidatus Kapabacteria bacterium]MDW8219857.1 cytochrome c peroxidase [Bacteroidota bacterium]
MKRLRTIRPTVTGIAHAIQNIATTRSCIALSLFSCIMCIIAACSRGIELVEPSDSAQYVLAIPPGFPPMFIPDYERPLTQAKIELGRKLFFDPILSINGTVACATCHQPNHAFTVPVPVPAGVFGRRGTRNAPTLTNVGYNRSFFWHGGSTSLQTQALSSLENEDEMGNDADNIVQTLRAHSEYPRLFRQVFGKEIDILSVLDAIAAFERTLISGNSRYDHFQRGDSSALNASERRGMALFFSERTQCASCHAGFNFTSGAFEDNGSQAPQYVDLGRYMMTGREEDKGKFKVPTLRNIARTAPYFHNGSRPTLESVIAHYNAGGSSAMRSPNQSPRVRPLGLTHDEQTDIINFLKALTDEEFVRPR